MPKITTNQQIAALLQAGMERALRHGPAKKTGKSERTGRSTPISRLGKTVYRDEQEQHRALVRAILTERFGAEAANDPSFIRIIDEVAETLEQNEGTRELLRRTFTEVTAEG